MARSQQRKKQYNIDRERAKSLSAQDIAPCPTPIDLEARAKCDDNFQFFCEHCFANVFPLKWSEDHLRVIALIVNVIVHGDSGAIAMPRGNGKTTLCEIAVIWAVLTGKHWFVMLIMATDPLSVDSLKSIKNYLQTNDKLLELYPEAIYPIRKLEGESRRCGGQRYYGKLTKIKWDVDEINMPNIPGSRCAGAVICAAGITGALRGRARVKPDGSKARPSLVLCDDPQTRESAGSLSQTRTRRAILDGDVKGLAGPGKKISLLVPCTVICSGDLSDQILNREKAPEYRGIRTKMLYEFPSDMKLWEEYGKIKNDALKIDNNTHPENKYYRNNRNAMDRGAKVAWEDRYNRDDELSGIQCAMNLFLKNEAVFAAEYQNAPLETQDKCAGLLTADQISNKINGMLRSEVSIGCNQITMFVDVQGTLLYWMICAWEDDFTGYVIDYGSYPDQKRSYFTLTQAQKTIQDLSLGAGQEAAIYAALKMLIDEKMPIKFRRDDGIELQIAQCLIDQNWGTSTEIVYQFCRQSEYSARLMPSHGMYIGASSKPMSEYTFTVGDKVGLNWKIPVAEKKRPIRHVNWDTNYWKSFIHARLAVAIGDRGCLSIFGRDRQNHAMLADHLTAESPVKVEGKGRTVDEWKQKPGVDNHLFDCIVGCAVSAAIQGVQIAGIERKEAPKKQRVSFSEMQQRARARR